MYLISVDGVCSRAVLVLFSALFLSLLLLQANLPLAVAETNFWWHVNDNYQAYVDPDRNHIGVPATTDVYNRTRCYCRSPYAAESQDYWGAAYFRIRYWNSHSKRLWDLEWTCKSNKFDSYYGDTECAPMQHASHGLRYGFFHKTFCATPDFGDKFCYTWERQADVRDDVYYNHQHRKLEVWGRPKYYFQRDVNMECNKLCGEHLENFEVMYYNDAFSGPAQINTIDFHDDVDPMCGYCT